MTGRIPILSTLVVLAAVAIMIALGIWQLGRAEEKEALLDRYARSQTMSSQAAWPSDPAGYESALYRHSLVDCRAATALNPVAGSSARGASGWAHRAACILPGGAEAEVALGWSRDPAPVEWTGGEVTGTIGPAGETIRLVASPPQAGLEQLAPPDPANLPNNHLSYAVQWFLFALTALTIYVLALRKKKQGS